MSKNLELGAFVPAADTPLQATVSTLGFPADWRDPVLDYYRRTWPERGRDRIEQVPIARLNEVLATVAPDLISVGRRAGFDDTVRWLYSTVEYPETIIRRIVKVWLQDFAATTEHARAYSRALSDLDFTQLQWRREQIDLLEATRSPAGTCIPAPHLYTVLPDLMADRIVRHRPYEIDGETVAFERVAPLDGDGAELLSWPPRRYVISGKDPETPAGTWMFSGYISIRLRTVPFDPVPRLHVSAGIRRWVRGKAHLPHRRSAAVYLRSTAALLDEAPVSPRFAIAKLEWNRSEGKVDWRRGGPESMLQALGAVEKLPLPDVFAKEADSWITGRDTVTAALCHHAMMGYHGVLTGLMPTEHRQLSRWIEEALAPDFVRAHALVPATPRVRSTHVLSPLKAIPKKEDHPGQIESVLAERAVTTTANGTIRRTFTAAALGEGTDLVVHVLEQNKYLMPELISAAEESLALSAYRTLEGPDSWAWDTPELKVRIHRHELGAAGSRLGEGPGPRKGAPHDTEVIERSRQVKQLVEDISARTEYGQIAIVQLESAKPAFRIRTQDPKFAIRLGCGAARTLTQFVAVREDKLEHPCKAAWDDCLRQLGMRFVPRQHDSLGLPQKLNHLAFWLVKRQSDSTNSTAQFTPVAVLLRPQENKILGRSIDTDDWVPYPELLLSLTGKVRPNQEKHRDRQQLLYAQFIKQTLQRFRAVPTLAYVHAQNSRSRWPWLLNGELMPDRMQLGNSAPERLTTQPKLRIVRVATGDRDETPRGWLAKPDGTAGHATGLWVHAEASEDARVFYSTSPKSSTASRVLKVDATKLTTNRRPDGTPAPDVAGINAWNPQLVELTMIGFATRPEAESYAMCVHQQRNPEDYRDTLRLPLAMHLAELAAEYALPFDDSDDRADDMPDEGDNDEEVVQ
ncbi:pPIWI_RE module domain-containing protein [Nocardia aurantia]|uniref:DUF3893 domain-containing protein n=1 Tax=Nocardia aurantia TaxID=2585199 RepID=A0A7K0E2V0_9NOCA|nr:DUF3962 domain-containing protein [Nocardia aurantia]MQY32037.1 hypothetical protein [Nocardia aurantia]